MPSSNSNDTIYFRITKDATQDFIIRSDAEKSINSIYFFSLFKNILTTENFNIGVDDTIFRDQNSESEIKIPKKGIYRFHIQMDTKVVYTPSITTGTAFKLFLDTGFTFKVDGEPIDDGNLVNQKPLHIYEIENTTTLPLIEYDFRIEADDKTFGVDFAPTIFYKNTATSSQLEMFNSAFDLKNITIIIQKISDLS